VFLFLPISLPPSLLSFLTPSFPPSSCSSCLLALSLARYRDIKPENFLMGVKERANKVCVCVCVCVLMYVDCASCIWSGAVMEDACMLVYVTRGVHACISTCIMLMH
jgi:hypothetical protein